MRLRSRKRWRLGLARLRGSVGVRGVGILSSAGGVSGVEILRSSGGVWGVERLRSAGGVRGTRSGKLWWRAVAVIVAANVFFLRGD